MLHARSCSWTAHHALHKKCKHAVPARTNIDSISHCKDPLAAHLQASSGPASCKHQGLTRCAVSCQHVNSAVVQPQETLHQGHQHTTADTYFSPDGHSSETNASGSWVQPGLLQLADVHYPDDLLNSAQAAAEHCKRIVLQMCNARPGIDAVLQLIKAEQALQHIMRPARYIQDYHPQASWRHAASKALHIAAQALQQLQCNEAATRVLNATCLHLQTERSQVTAGRARGAEQTTTGGGHSVSAATLVTACGTGAASRACTSGEKRAADLHDVVDVPVERQAWLHTIMHLLRSWKRASHGAATDNHSQLCQLQQQERECAAALRTLLLCPAAAPRLLLTSEQAELLAEAVPADALMPLSRAHCAWNSQQAQDSGIQEIHLSSGGQMLAAGSAKRLVQELYAQAELSPRSLRLYSDVFLSLSTLDAASDAVLDALTTGEYSSKSGNSKVQQQRHSLTQSASLPAAGDLWVLYVTQPVMVALLRQHPNEGVRWQVHHAALQPLALLQCQVLDHLVCIRNNIADHQGLPSHAHAVLDGSLLQDPATAAQFLSDVGEGLQPLAEHQLLHMAQVGTRAGLSVDKAACQAMQEHRMHRSKQNQHRTKQAAYAAHGSGSTWGFQPWDLDYVRHLQVQAMQLKDTAGAGRRAAIAGTGWEQYADYFTLGRVLQGLNRLLGRTLRLCLQPTCLTHADVSWLLTDRQPEARTGVVGKETGSQGSSSSSNGVAAVAGSTAGVDPAILLCFDVLSLKETGAHDTGEANNLRPHTQSDSRDASTTGGNSHGMHVGKLYLHIHSNAADYPFTTLLSPGSDVATVLSQSASTDTTVARGAGLNRVAEAGQIQSGSHRVTGSHLDTNQQAVEASRVTPGVPVVLMRVCMPWDSCPPQHDLSNYSHLIPQAAAVAQQVGKRVAHGAPSPASGSTVHGSGSTIEGAGSTVQETGSTGQGTGSTGQGTGNTVQKAGAAAARQFIEVPPHADQCSSKAAPVLKGACLQSVDTSVRLSCYNENDSVLETSPNSDIGEPSSNGGVNLQADAAAVDAAYAWAPQRLGHRIIDPLYLSMLLHELGHALQYVLSSSPALHTQGQKQQQKQEHQRTQRQQQQQQQQQQQPQVQQQQQQQETQKQQQEQEQQQQQQTQEQQQQQQTQEQQQQQEQQQHVSQEHVSMSSSTAASSTYVRAKEGSMWDVVALPAYLRSAVHWPLEWRELAAHVMERWARDPAALQLISQHARLGTPLAQHDAARAASLVSVATCPGAHLEVWEQTRAALAEQLMYAGRSVLHRPGTASANPTVGSNQGTAAAAEAMSFQGHESSSDVVGTAADGTQSLHHKHRPVSALAAHEAATQVLLGRHRHNMNTKPLLAAGSSQVDGAVGTVEWLDLQAVVCLEQQAVLGGSQAVYVLARMLAAAAWHTWLEQDSLSSEGGQAVRELLLQLPAFSCSLPTAVTALLQDVDGLQAVAAADNAEPMACVPDLAAACWQDIDLLG